MKYLLLFRVKVIKMKMLFSIFILFGFSTGNSLDTNNLFYISPTKYIPVNKEFNQLFIKNISKINIEINTNKLFGSEAEDVKSNTLYRKHDIYQIENSDKMIWSTLFSDNIDSVFKEDTGSFSYLMDYCSNDTLYKVNFSNGSTSLKIFFSHYDLNNCQIREVYKNELYFLKINHRYIQSLKDYLNKQIINIDNFEIFCNRK